MGVVLAPKHMSLANESKPDSRPGRHCVDLLRCLQNSACYSPMRIFLVVRLSYHINSGFVQYNRDFLQKPAGEHRRKRVLPRRVSLCVEIRFIPRRRCQPRELRRPMPHRLVDVLRSSSDTAEALISFKFPANAVPHTIAAIMPMKNFFIFLLLMQPLQ